MNVTHLEKVLKEQDTVRATQILDSLHNDWEKLSFEEQKKLHRLESDYLALASNRLLGGG